MKKTHAKLQGKVKHLRVLFFYHILLRLSYYCIFKTAKLNLFFIKAKLTSKLHQNCPA